MGRTTSQRLHQFLIGPNQDHIDLNKRNNQRSNLRSVTEAQNKQNLPSHAGSSSRFRGVCWSPRFNKWRAYANLEGKHHFLGYHAEEEIAAEAAADWRRRNMPFSQEALSTAYA